MLVRVFQIEGPEPLALLGIVGHERPPHRLVVGAGRVKSLGKPHPVQLQEAGAPPSVERLGADQHTVHVKHNRLDHGHDPPVWFLSSQTRERRGGGYTSKAYRLPT